jgi:hypothetical protein
MRLDRQAPRKAAWPFFFPKRMHQSCLPSFAAIRLLASMASADGLAVRLRSHSFIKCEAVRFKFVGESLSRVAQLAESRLLLCSGVSYPSPYLGGGTPAELRSRKKRFVEQVDAERDGGGVHHGK